jgi:hypothetical protein
VPFRLAEGGAGNTAHSYRLSCVYFLDVHLEPKHAIIIFVISVLAMWACFEYLTDEGKDCHHHF